MPIYWNFADIPQSEYKKAKVATVNGDISVLNKIAGKYNVKPSGLCNSCGTNVNAQTLEWFQWANNEKLFDTK